MSDYAATLGVVAAVIGLVSSIISRKKVVENRYITSTVSETKVKVSKRWYDYRGFVIFFLMFLYPIGAFALYKNSNISKAWKWVWFVFFTYVFLVVISDNPHKIQ